MKSSGLPFEARAYNSETEKAVKGKRHKVWTRLIGVILNSKLKAAGFVLTSTFYSFDFYASFIAPVVK